MNEHEWTWRCAEQLHEQWPRVDRSDLENVAEALHREDRWRTLRPEVAAMQWVAQGIPSQAQTPSTPVARATAGA